MKKRNSTVKEVKKGFPFHQKVRKWTVHTLQKTSKQGATKRIQSMWQKKSYANSFPSLNYIQYVQKTPTESIKIWYSSKILQWKALLQIKWDDYPPNGRPLVSGLIIRTIIRQDDQDCLCTMTNMDCLLVKETVCRHSDSLCNRPSGCTRQWKDVSD